MKEDFLHYIWKHKKIQTKGLKTTTGETIEVSSVGQHNLNSGPDFFNAHIAIDKQLWAGNVEVHVKSSDWFLHGHEQDRAYDNVILHLVWEHDMDVLRKDNTAVPTLRLKDFIGHDILNKYETLFKEEQHEKWINCEQNFSGVDTFVLNNWLERLYLERLERKTKVIEKLLEASKNNWEAVLFVMLAKNFGLKVNGDSFFSLARSVDFSIVRKVQSKHRSLEALLFGQLGLLEDDVEDAYYLDLIKEYKFLKQKFKLENNQIIPCQFFRLRPSNFPTIRISQLASLYYEHQNLFSKIRETNHLNDFYELFKVSTSRFWETHYTFQKESTYFKKTLTRSFIDLVLINTVLPFKFYYATYHGKNVDEDVIQIARSIASENNSIIGAFNKLKKVSTTSLDSQALIQLKTEYCEKNRCLQCAIGNRIMK